MRLEEIGYNETIEKLRIELKPDDFETGRVIAGYKERYTVFTEEGEYEAEITGNMRFTAKSHEDFPAVGDWVLLKTYSHGFAIIHNILPRFSIIKRQAVGQPGEVQVIAANVDYAFLVQAADRDFNLNRLERYLTICFSSRVTPVIVLTKTDLIDELRVSEIVESIRARISDIPVFVISNETHRGYEAITSFIKRGKTYCMLGSSGVGKSTLLNNLSGSMIMKTDSISHSTNKGRHITSHRELIILKSGGILIDNPGMREVGITDSAEGLKITFDVISSLSKNCRFKDCTHTNEAGCRVIDAIEKGEIDRSSYENYLKMEKENAFFESTVNERRKKDKHLGKIIRNYKKDMKNNGY